MSYGFSHSLFKKNTKKKGAKNNLLRNEIKTSLNTTFENEL